MCNYNEETMELLPVELAVGSTNVLHSELPFMAYPIGATLLIGRPPLLLDSRPNRPPIGTIR